MTVVFLTLAVLAQGGGGTNRDVQVVLATFSPHTSTVTALHLGNEGTG